MANKDLALFTKADLEKTLKDFTETFSQVPQKKLAGALNYAKDKYKDYPNHLDGPFINHVLRIPVWLIQNGVKGFSVVIASFYRYSKKEEAIEVAHSCYEHEIKEIIELIGDKDYSNFPKEDRFDLRLLDFEKAVESSVEAGLILLSEYFDNRIDFKTEKDDKKISWSKYNEPRIQIFKDKLLDKIKNIQKEPGNAIGLNVRSISMILQEDLDLVNQTLQPV